MRLPPCNSYGDVNGDGYVSVGDGLLVEQYLVGTTELTADQLTRADVNGDGVVTATDAMLIGQYAVGEIDTFPVCQVLDHPIDIWTPMITLMVMVMLMGMMMLMTREFEEKG